METVSLGVALLPAQGPLGSDPAGGPPGLDDIQLHGAAALLRELLVDAIRVYCRGIALDGTWSPEYREAKRWIFDQKSRSFTSFATLCEVFAINAGELRRRLRRFPFEPDPRLLRLARLADAEEPLGEAPPASRSA